LDFEDHFGAFVSA
jgi:site-specific DNA recombinase